MGEYANTSLTFQDNDGNIRKARQTGPAGEKMESILWAINLVALVYLCFWAIRQDKLPPPDAAAETDA